MLTILKRNVLAKWIAATLFVATSAGVLSGCVVETGHRGHHYYRHDYHRGY